MGFGSGMTCGRKRGNDMASDNYELLDNFLGNWFHQDWDLEASNWQQLVEKFKVISREERIKQVHLDLKSFLKEKKDDDELCEIVFEEFGWFLAQQWRSVAVVSMGVQIQAINSS